MPIYEYICQSCGVKFEKFVRSMSSANTVKCPTCQSQEVNRAFSVFGLSSAASSGASCATGST